MISTLATDSPSQNESNTSGFEEKQSTVSLSNVGVEEPKKDEDTLVDDVKEYVTGWKLASLMAATSTACFLMLLDMSITVTATPRITTQFHSLSDIGWYGSAYNLASASLQPLSGKLYTYFKLKWVFLMFLLVFELGSLICAIATSSNMFIIGRAVAGLGSSGIMNGSFAIVAAAAPLEKRPSLIGMIMGISQLGLVSGPLIGGAFTEYTTWRWCFYVNLPLGAVATPLIMLGNIPERLAKPKSGLLQIALKKFDLPGFAFFVPFATMILMALEWGGNQYAWNSANVIGLFCGGGATLVIFLLWERRIGEDAMIPLSIIRKREVWTSCLSNCFLIASQITAVYYLPIYFQSIKGDTPFISGVNLLPAILAQLASAVLSGFLLQKVGYYLPFSLLSGCFSAVGHGLLSTLSPTSSTAKWAGYQILLGLGRGMGMQMAVIAIQANAAPEVAQVATAILVFCQTFGGAIFLCIANSIFNNKLKDELVSSLGGVDVQVIIDAGATGVRSVVSAQDLPAALMAYAKGFDAVFYLMTAMSGCMFLVSWGMGWTDIRRRKISAAAAMEA